MAERLALPTLDNGVSGSSPAGGEIISEPKRRFIAQSFSCSLLHRPYMNEILLKGTLNRNSTDDHSVYEGLWMEVGGGCLEFSNQ